MVGKTLYRIQWHSFEACDDTWKPIRHLARSKVLSYYKSTKLPVPETMSEADES